MLPNSKDDKLNKCIVASQEDTILMHHQTENALSIRRTDHLSYDVTATNTW